MGTGENKTQDFSVVENGAFFGTPKAKVGFALKQQLDICDAIIQRVRKLLNRGPANNKPSLTKTDYIFHQNNWEKNVETIIRAKASYLDWRHINNTKYKGRYTLRPKKKMDFIIDKNSIDPNELHPMRIAAAALTNKTGYCTEHAAVTYVLLRDKLTTSQHIYFCRSNSLDHWFTIVSLKTKLPVAGKILFSATLETYKNEVILVDPWPPEQKAVLYGHSGFIKKYQYITVLKNATGKSTGVDADTKLNKAIAKYELLSRSREEGIKGMVDDEIALIKSQAKKGNISAHEQARKWLKKLLDSKQLTMYDLGGGQAYYSEK